MKREGITIHPLFASIGLAAMLSLVAWFANGVETIKTNISELKVEVATLRTELHMHTNGGKIAQTQP